MGRLRVYAFGGLRILDSTGCSVTLPARKPALLLVYLAMQPGRPLPRARLSALLWGSGGESAARGSLRQALLVLRRALALTDAELVSGPAETIRLEPDVIDVDALQLEATLAAQGAALPPDRLSALLEAIDGDFLEGFEAREPGIDEWLSLRRAQLRTCLTAAHAGLLRTYRERSEPNAAIGIALRLLALEPLREDVHRDLMELQAGQRRWGAALHQFQLCRDILARELGVRPQPATVQLRDAIERQRALAACDAPLPREDSVASTSAELRQARPAVGQIDLSLPDKPSIAVLPFVNLSGDPEQEYFTDGITEDIITELSRFHSLFVIARNSSFSYKGQSPDIRRVGTELGVRYVLEGSIRKSAQRIRVSGQLIDALTGTHLWAEKYDRVLEDIFEVQEELTRSIVAAIAPHIDDAERDKVHRRRPESLGAYELAVRALAKSRAGFHSYNLDLRNEALAEAQAALAIDPRSGLALQAMALGQLQQIFLGTAPDIAAAWRMGFAAANQAIEIDRNDSDAYAIKAFLLCFSADKQRAAEDLPNARRAYELNPNSSLAVAAISTSELCTGMTDGAIAHLHQAMRLNPRDPLRFTDYYMLLSAAYLFTVDYVHGVEFALLGLADTPGLPQGHGLLAMNYVGLGDIAKAKDACAAARRLAPAWVERGLAGGFIYRKPEHLRRATTFLRIAAGLEDPGAADALR